MDLFVPCDVKSCTERVVQNPKRTLQLCSKHVTDRDAMLLQASKSTPVELATGKVNLKDFLEDMERQDRDAFLQQLNEFCEQSLGLKSYQASHHNVNV